MRWQWRCGLAVGECEKATPTRKGGHLTSLVPPISSTFSFGPSSSPPSPGFPECFVCFVDSSTFPLNFRDSLFWVLPWGKSSNVIVKVLYLACHMLRLRLRLSFSLVTRGHKKCKRLGGGREGGAPSPPPPPPHPHHTTTTTTTSPSPPPHHRITSSFTPQTPTPTDHHRTNAQRFTSHAD